MDSYNNFNKIAFKLLNEMKIDKTDNSITLNEEEETVKSSMPEKRAMIFIKEMKGQFKRGEEVDVVKEGSNYNVFKRNISGGAHPVKLNEKQATEFFGHKLDEAFGEKLGSTIRKAGQTISKTAKDAYYSAKGTTETQSEINNLGKQFNKFLNSKGVKQFTDQQVSHFLQDKVLRPLLAKYSGEGESPNTNTQNPTNKQENQPETKYSELANDIRKIPIMKLRSELDRRAKEDEVKRAEDEKLKENINEENNDLQNKKAKFINKFMNETKD